MADSHSPTPNLSSIDDEQTASPNQQQETTNNDWPWPTDDQQQQENAMVPSGLMHLITSTGGRNVTDNTNDESDVTLVTNGQSHDHIEQPSSALGEEELHEDQSEHAELSLAPSLPAVPMDPEQQIAATETGQPNKSQHNIAEIHREMMVLIPIPQAWPHIRHQSNLFSYPDLPHFNVIRQATFREGRFVCPFCTVDFASKEGIRYHLYNSCTKSPYPKAFFRCLMCGSELADRSSLRTHLARHGAEDGSAVSADKIDVSRKPAVQASETPNSKKSRKKKKNNHDLTPPQMVNPMIAMTTSVSPRGIDAYNLPPTMINPQMSLPIIKSELNDSDPKRKRGRPPKTKDGPGPIPVAPYTKHSTMIPPMPTITNQPINTQVILNDQMMKTDLHKLGALRSPRTIDISSELAELARSRMREHIEFATDTLLPDEEQEISTRLRTEGSIQCRRCRGKTQFNNLKKLKEHLKTDCPLGPVMAVCKFCGIPFSSVSSVCDHLELCHDDSHDTSPEDPWRVNDRAFRSAFARYKFPINGRISFSAPTTIIGQLIPQNESAACLSNGASSLRVRMLSCDRFLNPLDSFAASHVIVLNVGRPIRCVEWLPRAVDVMGSQYVALALEQWSYDGTNQLHGNYSSSNNQDRRSPPGSTLLLILNCGRLRQSLHVPNLHVTVAADFGQVTCLKWLPERPGMNDPYLSYLAIGTSQGIVIIFGVPHGASRNLCTINSGAQLVPPLNRRKDGSIGCAEYGSCTALDWCHDNPNKICAGFENGIVLMWELNSKSLVEQTTNCSLIYPVRRFFAEDASIQDVKFIRNYEHLIAISLKNKQSWTVWTTRDENIFCYRHWSNASEFVSSPLHDVLYAGCAHANNQNELLSVPTHSIILPGQNVSNHLQNSMLSAWQIVSLDHSEWIDSVAYADLDGTVWVARGDSSTWAQTNPKFRPSACVAKLSTYLTNSNGPNSGNLTDSVGIQQYNQGAPTGQYCVQIAIERTEYASSNLDPQHDETHKVHVYRKIRFNPNPGTHGWIASADKVGLFLLFRLSTSDSPLSEKLTQRLQRVQVL